MTPTETQLRTPRLLLAAPGAEHADAVLRLASDPDVALWNPLRGVTDEASARDWCLRAADWTDGTHATFLILDNGGEGGSASGAVAGERAVLGNIAVHSVNERSASAEVGYRVAPEARGRGFAVEALLAVSTWAFEAFGVVRLELCHAAENPASCRVAERSGFLHEGTLRLSYRYGDGLLHDEHIHGRLVTDDVTQLG
ncbi:GNAT family N-acetyltransferase [Streptacidiphilus rugosus]|uniref:GNAT family N-acetyltransferase n=1 Tax=Streptacidiphilus rugosus TaxID=405783 RepID=UPI000B160340|nr:GNAT family N-acetyltransferase [Streptacidiphilus rugosus]